MRYVLEYPNERPIAPVDFPRPELIREAAVRAEAVGFDAVALSERPAPRPSGGATATLLDRFGETFHDDWRTS
ncbi:hypothetical protein [Nocardia sp. NPDC057227]|uniref:hypothetical protein n=1 Tax=Nocardia sp. NPDC057227 TaxID=3346056 RepID=UPI003630731D